MTHAAIRFGVLKVSAAGRCSVETHTDTHTKSFCSIRAICEELDCRFLRCSGFFENCYMLDVTYQ